MAKSIAEKLKALGVSASRGTITYIPPEDLILFRDPEHPLYDERVEWPLSEGLIDSIEAHGVMQPVSVRLNGDTPNGKPILEVIFGVRRTTHLLEFNRRQRASGKPPAKMPVILITGTDLEMYLRKIAENAQRADETVRSAAQKTQAAMKLGASIEEIAKAMGTGDRPKSLAYVNNLIAYTNLHPDAQTAIDIGDLPIGAIASFSTVPREEQVKTLEIVRVSGATKRHEVAEAVRASRKGENYIAPEQKKVWDRREMTELRDALVLYPLQPREVKTGIALLQLLLSSDLKTIEEHVELHDVASKILGRRRKKKKKKHAAAEEVRAK